MFLNIQNLNNVDNVEKTFKICRQVDKVANWKVYVLVHRSTNVKIFELVIYTTAVYIRVFQFFMYTTAVE